MGIDIEGAEFELAVTKGDIGVDFGLFCNDKAADETEVVVLDGAVIDVRDGNDFTGIEGLFDAGREGLVGIEGAELNFV